MSDMQLFPPRAPAKLVIRLAGVRTHARFPPALETLRYSGFVSGLHPSAKGEAASHKRLDSRLGPALGPGTVAASLSLGLGQLTSTEGRG